MTKKFELFFERLKKVAKVKTDKELYEFLNINKTTLSMWKKREKVDYDLLFTLFEHINIHWLITGVGNENILVSEDSRTLNNINGLHLKNDNTTQTQLLEAKEQIIKIQTQSLLDKDKIIISLEKELSELKYVQKEPFLYHNVAGSAPELIKKPSK